MADDFGYECVAANGGESYATPRLDALAASGMRFTQCYVQPLCTPTRVELMTGKSNVRNYVDFGILPPGETTFANLLREAGYATAVCGKWQLGRDPELPRRTGFDESFLWQHTRRPPRYANPGLEIDGVEKDFRDGEYGPSLVNDFAIDFIARRAEAAMRGEQPFFLYYPMILTHDPFQPTPESEDWDPRAVGEQVNADPKHFGDMTAFMDRLIGKLLDQLEASGVRDNTLVLFLGDNGTSRKIESRFRGRAFRGGKGQTTHRGMHVPCIASWPAAVPAGRVCDDLVAAVDILPTLCAAANVDVPAPLDGTSFLPQLRGQQGPRRDWIYSWYRPYADGATRECAFDSKHKLYADGAFYDLAADPDETAPMTAADRSAEQAAAAARLREAIAGFAAARAKRQDASRGVKDAAAKPLTDRELTARFGPPAGIVPVDEPTAFAPVPTASGPAAPNAVIGTQTIGGRYRFTPEPLLVETAEAIRAMGSDTIKFHLWPGYGGAQGNVEEPRPGIQSLVELARDEPAHRRVLDMPFSRILLWAHTFHKQGSPDIWRQGLSDAAAEAERHEIYDLACHLLRTYSGSGKTFYIGHWEGDGWLRGTVDAANDARVDEVACQGMADWLTVRQRAVDDAKRDTPHEGVALWHYTEVNHVKLAMQGRPALVNRVLPRVPVDLVSYSCYDTQQDPALLKAALSFIETQLPPKPGIAGRRVFIGEYGFPADRFPPPEQDRLSRQVIKAGLEWGAPLILYWELYNNELTADGRQRGFWMIDDKGQKQPIYRTHEAFYARARNAVAESERRHDRPQSAMEFRAAALEFLARP
jgi:arylsulfatase A